MSAATSICAMQTYLCNGTKGVINITIIWYLADIVLVAAFSKGHFGTLLLSET